MADNTVRGRFVWHELITPNAAGAHEFYGRTVGWTKQGWEHDPSYQMFAASNGPFGATVEKRDAVPQWLPYIGTTDVDATVERATRLGATVTMPPATLPNSGRYAVLTDPHGAAFGLHGSAGEPRPEPATTYGDFSWHELATNGSAEDAFAFYSELFGWDKIAVHDMGEPMGLYVIFGRNGKQLGGMFRKGDTGKPGPAYWIGYVSVKDLDRSLEDMKAARATVLNGPMDVPGGDRIAQLADPHGAFFAVHMAAADVKKSVRAEPARVTRSSAAEPAAKKSATKSAKKKASGKSAASKPVAKKAARKPAKKTAKKAAKKAAKKTARPAAKKTAKKAAGKKAQNKGAKKVAKKTAKKAAKKGSKKAKARRR